MIVSLCNLAKIPILLPKLFTRLNLQVACFVKHCIQRLFFHDTILALRWYVRDCEVEDTNTWMKIARPHHSNHSKQPQQLTEESRITNKHICLEQLRVAVDG